MLVLPIAAQLLSTALFTSGQARDTALSRSTVVPSSVDAPVPVTFIRYGKIAGRVVNPSQTPIPGVLISIDIIAGGRVHSASEEVSSPFIVSADTLRTVDVVLKPGAN